MLQRVLDDGEVQAPDEDGREQHRVRGAQPCAHGREHTRVVLFGPMAEVREPTLEDLTALTCAATPHFAFQIRARVRDLVRDLPDGHPVRTARGGADRDAGAARALDLDRRRGADRVVPANRLGDVKSHRPARAAT